MLEIIVSILYFTNKVLLFLEKKSGWLIGILASALSSVYFLGLKFYIIFLLEIACFLIMVFGWFGKKNSKLFSYFVYSAITVVMLFLLFNIEESGPMEFFTSICFMAAFLLLAENRWHLGWSSLSVAHFLMLFISLGKDQNLFATMQAMSVIVCLLAIIKKTKFIKNPSRIS